MWDSKEIIWNTHKVQLYRNFKPTMMSFSLCQAYDFGVSRHLAIVFLGMSTSWLWDNFFFPNPNHLSIYIHTLTVNSMNYWILSALPDMAKDFPLYRVVQITRIWNITKFQIQTTLSYFEFENTNNSILS